MLYYSHASNKHAYQKTATLLPRETIDYVLYQLCHDKGTMIACMLSSHVLAERTCHYFFREKLVVSMKNTIKDSIQKVAQVPKAVYHVKQLTIKTSFGSDTNLILNICDIAKIKYFMPNLLNVVFEDCSWTPTACVSRALCIDNFSPWYLHSLTLFNVWSVDGRNVLEVFELITELNSLI